MNTSPTANDLVNTARTLANNMEQANDTWSTALGQLSLDDQGQSAIKAIDEWDDRLVQNLSTIAGADLAAAAQSIETYLSATDSFVDLLRKDQEVRAKAILETTSSLKARHELIAHMDTIDLTLPLEEEEPRIDCADAFVAGLGVWLDANTSDPLERQAILEATIALANGERVKLKRVGPDEVMKAWEGVAKEIAQVTKGPAFGDATTLGQIFCLHEEIDDLFVAMSKAIA
jgi:hypothetical protein